MNKTCQFMLTLCCITHYAHAVSEPEINGHFTAEIYMEDVPSTDHLSFDSRGNLYTGKENFSNQRLQINKISNEKQHSTFGPAILDPDAVIVDMHGYLSTYGPDSILVAGIPGRITQISADGTQSSVLYQFTRDNPQQMTFDSTGRLLFAKCSSGTLGVISGGALGTLASFGKGTCPAGVAVDRYDNIYLTDHFSEHIIKLGPDGTILNHQLASGFSKPDTLAFDFSGEFGNLLYVASRFEGTIHSINTETGEKKIFASGFNTIYGLTFGPDNCLYASEMRENTIWKICPDNTELLIDIKPGNHKNTITPRSWGKIPVAILGSEKLDVLDIDVHSATFGITGNEESFSHYAHSTQSDFNHDGHMDIMLHFYTRATKVNHATKKLILKVKKLSGLKLQGSDAITTLGNCEYRSTPKHIKHNHTQSTVRVRTPKPIYTQGYFTSSNILLSLEPKENPKEWQFKDKLEEPEFSSTLDMLETSTTGATLKEPQEAQPHKELEIELTHCKHDGEKGHFEHGDMPCPFEYGDKPPHCKHEHQTNKQT